MERYATQNEANEARRRRVANNRKWAIIIGVSLLVIHRLFLILNHHGIFVGHSEAPAPQLSETYLVGNWYADLNPGEELELGHYFTFLEGGSGNSTYYFPRENGDGYCRLSIPFNWKLMPARQQSAKALDLQVRFFGETATEEGCAVDELDAPGVPLFKSIKDGDYRSQNVKTFYLSLAEDGVLNDQIIVGALGANSVVYEKRADLD